VPQWRSGAVAPGFDESFEQHGLEAAARA